MQPALVQTVKNLTRSHKLYLLTAERRGVNAEEHRHGRLHQRTAPAVLQRLRVADGVGDVLNSPRPVIVRYRPLRDIAVDTLQTQMRRALTCYFALRLPFTIDDMTCWFGFTLPRLICRCR